MPKKIIVANWKMHKTLSEGLAWVQEIKTYAQKHSLDRLQIIILPPFIYLDAINKLLTSALPLLLGAQHSHQELRGAFTGEISPPMLASVGGVGYVLVGHSERRQHFGETNKVVASKISSLLKSQLRPIVCCGEPLSIRERKQQYAFIRRQLQESILGRPKEELQQFLIAYEPVWAIGTGKTPQAADIEAMQYEIRHVVAQYYDTTLASSLPILYGGSCNAQNVATFINLPGINGVLIGTSCLNPKEFTDILKVAAIC
jgi:triosephosphate isomerase